MEYVLGKSIKIGDKVLTNKGWTGVYIYTDDGVRLNNGEEVKYGEVILGWKAGKSKTPKTNKSKESK